MQCTGKAPACALAVSHASCANHLAMASTSRHAVSADVAHLLSAPQADSHHHHPAAYSTLTLPPRPMLQPGFRLPHRAHRHLYLDLVLFWRLCKLESLPAEPHCRTQEQPTYDRRVLSRAGQGGQGAPAHRALETLRRKVPAFQIQLSMRRLSSSPQTGIQTLWHTASIHHQSQTAQVPNQIARRSVGKIRVSLKHRLPGWV